MFVLWLLQACKIRHGGPWPCAALAVCLVTGVIGASEQPTRKGAQIQQEDREFWAFRPLSRAPLPELPHPERLRSPVDVFVLQELALRELSFSADAPPVGLLRRLQFDLIGLPPSPAEVDAYLADGRPDAYERLVDRLLASPHFGERWGRHWLDVVGYSDVMSYDGDTTGIFGFIQDRWRYRDYVIDAFNSDKSYARFLAEQIAGDELIEWRTAEHYTPEMVSTLAATGFWRNAEDRSESAKEPVYKWAFLHNTMETFGTSVLGLTLRCARCHDHKHEPIPQRDYYQLLSLITPAFNVDNWKDPKQRATPSVSTVKKDRIDTANASTEERLTDLKKQRAAVTDAREEQLLDLKLVVVPESLRADTKAALAEAVEKRTAVQRELVLKYADELVISGKEIQDGLTEQEQAKLAEINDNIAAGEQQLETHGWIQAAYDVGPPPVTHLLERGEFKNPGPAVQPGFVSVLSSRQTAFGQLVKPLPASSGRRAALARWLTVRDTPASALTARVIANRVWQHLTGVGIVPTSENLGMSGEKPTFPGLLDWLAAGLVERDWRVKPLVRNLVCSSVYRQASRREVPRAGGRKAQEVDPGNQWLWKSRLRRLESEVIRDSMLVASGRFDRSLGGKPVPLKYARDGVASFNMDKLPTPSAKWRRSVYLFQRRVYHLTMLGVFDQPVLGGSVCRRNVSAVTLQSLSMLNDELVLEQADLFSDRVAGEAGASPGERIDLVFRIALARPPSAEELQWSGELLEQQTERYRGQGMSQDDAAGRALMHLCRAVLNSSEFLYVE